MTPVASGVTARPLRSDAAQNLRRIHAAALEVISARGVDAGMEQIAQRAGVGVGTLYRRFPNKDALIDDLMRTILADLIDAARTALTSTDGDGLEWFLNVLGRSLVTHRGCAQEMFRRRAPGSQVRDLRALYAQLTEQAKRDGRLAPWVTVSDVQALIWGMQGVVNATATAAPDTWRRFLEVQLAGLRNTGQPLSAVSANQLAASDADRVAPAG